MVRLEPVKDLVCHLVLDILACHARLVYEELADEDLGEGVPQMIVLLLFSRHVVTEIYLRAPN